MTGPLLTWILLLAAADGVMRGGFDPHQIAPLALALFAMAVLGSRLRALRTGMGDATFRFRARRAGGFEGIPVFCLLAACLLLPDFDRSGGVGTAPLYALVIGALLSTLAIQYFFGRSVELCTGGLRVGMRLYRWKTLRNFAWRDGALYVDAGGHEIRVPWPEDAAVDAILRNYGWSGK